MEIISTAFESIAMDTGFLFNPSFTAFIPQYNNLPGIQDSQPSLVPCAAYDIGSGATKFMGALVNVETLSIEHIFSQGSFNVAYREDLHLSTNNTFSDLIQEMGLQALTQAHLQIEQDYHNSTFQGYGDIQHFAVATAAFRAADNGQVVADYFSAEFNMPVNIISQEEEGKLAYYSAVSQSDHNETTALPIVWDIGGGSMQLTFKDSSDHFHIMGGEIASQTFQAQVSEQILKFEDSSTSPNPMSEANVTAAIQLAKELLTFDPTATTIIKQQINEGTPVFAVGSVHNFGITPLCQLAGIESDKDHYTQNDLMLAIKLLTDKTDAQIMQLNHLPNLALAKTQQTNLILVYAMMDLMGIDSVRTVKSSNVEGLLLMNAEPKKSIPSPIYTEQGLFYA